MTIVDRFLQLQLPLDQCVVIGSGILDVLNLRASGDIDLVVSEELFERLQQSGEWQSQLKHEETVLLKDDAEVWQSWGSDGAPNFDQLYKESLTIDGVHFADPRFVIAWKQARGLEKDRRDIQLLEEYLKR